MSHPRTIGRGIVEIRIWLGELPEECNCEGHQNAAGEELSAEDLAASRAAAVEVFWPVAGMALYGLLGGVYIPAPSGGLQVAVKQLDEPGRIFVGSLAGQCDVVRLRVPEEYFSEIRDGVQRGNLELPRPLHGKLTINCGGCGDIGSASAIFKYVAAALTKYIALGNYDISDDDLLSYRPSKPPWLI